MMVVMQATMCTRRAAFDTELSEQAYDEDENVSLSPSNRVLESDMEVSGIARGGTTHTDTAEFELTDMQAHGGVRIVDMQRM